MLFSETFSITIDGSETWFDPLLTMDTRLYVDPFLIFQDEFGPFVGAHQEIVDYYQCAFELVALAGEDKKPQPWNGAISILGTPEVEEFCLGVTAAGTRGAGTGKGKARLIAEAFLNAIRFGLANPAHFETVQLFREGIAEDTVSDAVGNILRHRFSDFTNSVCSQYGVPTEQKPHLRGRFNPTNGRWERIVVDAPINPFSGKQILLVPKQYLRPMPTLNPDDFWGYCWDQDSQQLRTELGEEISRNVNKDVILEKALMDYQSVEEFVAFLERVGGAPYDLEKDPKGLIKWYYKSKEFVESNPVKLVFSNDAEFDAFLDSLMDIFKNYVENQGGWELVYNDDGQPKSESACQRLFLGIVRHYCLANDIDVSPEVNIGRGPVDFKISKGVKYSALIEMKLAKNSKFWNGVEKQLPKYLEAEGIKKGRFLVVLFNEEDVGRLKPIRDIINKVNDATGLQIRHQIVEAVFRPPSASKLK